VAAAPPYLLPGALPPPMRPMGLFDVALGPMPMPVPEVEGAGLQYVPDDCEDDIFLYQINCPPVSGSKTFSGVETAVSGAPFAAITSYTCGSVGFSLEEAEARVRLRMSLREQRAVEKRVWQGFNNSNGQGVMAGLLASAAAVDLGASSCPTEAVAKLEQALADNAIVGGLIHARPYMASHLAASHLTEITGPRTRATYAGTPIVFGRGYAGTGPTGQAVTATAEYMYVSGRIAIWAGDVQVPDPRQTFDRTNNQVLILAERVFVATVECGVWFTQVTRDCTTD
jgi:hypothetical protein